MLLKEVEIPLPALGRTQRRIVAEIEATRKRSLELKSEIIAYRERIQRVLTACGNNEIGIIIHAI